MTTPKTSSATSAAERRQARIRKLIERHLALRAKGIEKFDKARAALQKAMAAGLPVGQPIEIPGSGVYALVDNFVGEKSGGWATVPRFELKKASRKKLEADQAARTEAAELAS